MSSVVKIKSKNGKANARINDTPGFGTEDFENEEEYFKKLEEEKKDKIFEEGKQSAIEEMEKKFAADLSVKYEEYDKLMNSINEQLNDYQKSFESQHNLQLHLLFVLIAVYRNAFWELTYAFQDILLHQYRNLF